MTAIAGLWLWDQDRSGSTAGAQDGVTKMVHAQAPYGPNAQDVAAHGACAFGRALYKILPEDSFDRQPLFHSESGSMLVADLRIDNRSELLSYLGLGSGASLSDSDLLFAGLLRSGAKVLDRLVGDFAFAFFDGRTQRLLLARDQAGQRPLHYAPIPGGVAFASMPSGLLALPQVSKAVDLEQLAAFVADVPRASGVTYFRGISRVDPGCMLQAELLSLRVVPWWTPPERELRFASDRDYEEGLRDVLEVATRARLRGTEELVGAQLSAGLDSSSVATTAARLIRANGRVQAFTSAPRAGFAGPILSGRIGDESALAGEIAAMHPNIIHEVVRSGALSPLNFLGALDTQFQEPVGHPCNIVWWASVHDAARRQDVRVMLTGEMGNLTISAGNLAILAELIRTGHFFSWAREARSIAGTGPTWRGVLATSFGPWTPKWLWNAAVRQAGAGAVGDAELLVAPKWRSVLADRLGVGHGRRPQRNYRQVRAGLLRMQEGGNFRKGILARWGIDERDPTADRRVVEYCLALPADQMMRGGVTRRLARTAFADRLPQSVIHGPRGYQYADWYEGISREGLHATLDRLESGPASELLNFPIMREWATAWPTIDPGALPAIARYRTHMLMALSAGAFANSMG